MDFWKWYKVIGTVLIILVIIVAYLSSGGDKVSNYQTTQPPASGKQFNF